MVKVRSGEKVTSVQGDEAPRSPGEWDALARACRGELRASIETSLHQLFSAAVQVAMTGPCRDWSEKQPEGAVMDITTESLIGSSDEVVAAVGRAVAELEAAWKVLKDPPSVH